MHLSRVLQISDLHLLEDKTALLKGVNPWNALDQMLNRLRSFTRDVGEVDLLIITGDLAQDEQLATYEALADVLCEWLPMCRMIPGNHDDREFIQQVFGNVLCADVDRIGFAENVGSWRLIGIDSHVPGEVAGQVGAEQLKWLQSELESHPQETLIFVHHPPFDIGSSWVDAINLRNGAELVDVIRQFSHVKGVSCGHVHQEFDGGLDDLRMLTTPAVVFQFEPDASEPKIDRRGAGFRIFKLDEGRFETTIERLP